MSIMAPMSLTLFSHPVLFHRVFCRNPPVQACASWRRCAVARELLDAPPPCPIPCRCAVHVDGCMLPGGCACATSFSRAGSHAQGVGVGGGSYESYSQVCTSVSRVFVAWVCLVDVYPPCGGSPHTHAHTHTPQAAVGGRTAVEYWTSSFSGPPSASESRRLVGLWGRDRTKPCRGT
jgi:hypothetical protein